MELVFGGTFDPPTLAHVLLPPAACRAVGADGVRYVPAATSPHKLDAPPTAAEHRVQMLRLALADTDGVLIDLRELDRPGPSYTIDTLEALQAEAPEPRRLLIGSDQARVFRQWHRWEAVIDLAPPLVLLRHDDDAERLLAEINDERWRPWLLDLGRRSDSSTRVRAGDLDIVPDAVARWITEHGLYEVRQ